MQEDILGTFWTSSGESNDFLDLFHLITAVRDLDFPFVSPKRSRKWRQWESVSLLNRTRSKESAEKTANSNLDSAQDRRTQMAKDPDSSGIDGGILETTEEAAAAPETSPFVPEVVPRIGCRLTYTTEALKIGMQARIAARVTERTKAIKDRRRKQERRQEQKAAKTLSAILLAFIVTWTPYNLFTVIMAFFPNAINSSLYAFGKFSEDQVFKIPAHISIVFVPLNVIFEALQLNSTFSEV